MAPGGNTRSLEEHVANLAKAGITWQPPPDSRDPKKPPVASPPRFARHRPKQFRTAKGPGPNSGSESESEMIGKNCTTDLTGEMARQKRTAHKGVLKKQVVSPSVAVKLHEDVFKDLGLKAGDKADKNESLVPWKFLVRYCELYVGKSNTPIVEPYFETKNIFTNQDWDFYYLFEPEDLDGAAILFVPTYQLEAYLHQINKKQDLALKIPGGGVEVKFARQFGWLSTPQPRYLGRTTGISSLQKLKTSMPLPEPEDTLDKATVAEQEEFAVLLKKIKESWAGTKRSEKGSKARKKALVRYDNRKAWGHATKRVQRYLGLREKCPSVVSYDVYTGQKQCTNKLVLDVNEPAPFDPEDEVVFICVDIETYEKNPGLVTEIGFAILDTKNLRGVAPGDGAENWFKLIHARHLRIKEYKYMRNSQYVEGWPEHFQFGESEIVGIDEVEEICTKILTPESPSGEARKVVIIGHDVNQDINLLYGIDVDIYNLPGLLEVVDNQRMQQHNSKYVDPQKLSIVLNGLHIPHCYLHNGGNDAVYTLQAMLALAVSRRQATLAQGPKSKLPRPRPKYDDLLVDAGWTTGGEETDGGRAPYLPGPNAHMQGKTGDAGVAASVEAIQLEDSRPARW